VAQKPEMFDKIRVVSGDISLPSCGLSPEDFHRVTKTAQVVFHLAASLKNEAPLRYNILHNLVSTKNVIELAKKMENLIHIQHLSTAFCNIEPEFVYDKVYPLNHDPDDLIKMSETMSDDEMEAIQKEIMGPFPNTYVFTKRLAEILVEREYGNLPICIARPTVVLPTYAEPFQGWVDSLNGIVGIMYAAGAGVLRSMLCDPKSRTEYIPVDMAICSMILFAKQVSTASRSKEIPIITMTCCDVHKLEIGRLFRMVRAIGRQYPLTWCVW
jgi:alcohol-forming fatty acyl-CoA reductase